MSCAAVIAVKGAATAKTRLAAELAPAARRRLVEAMLARVLGAVRAAGGIIEVIVVSTERRNANGSLTAIIDDARGPSAALEAGAHYAAAHGHAAALLLPADLALVTAADLNALIAAGKRAGAALAPDHSGEGTNALYLPLALPIRLEFGPMSSARHVAACRIAGLVPAIVERPGLAVDIDAAGDLERLRGIPEYEFLWQSA